MSVKDATSPVVHTPDSASNRPARRALCSRILTALIAFVAGIAMFAPSASAHATIDSLSILTPSCGGLESPMDYSGRVRATITITDCSNTVVATTVPTSGSRNLCYFYGVGTHVADFQYIPKAAPGATVVVTLALTDGFDGQVLDSESVAFNCTTGGPPACAKTPRSDCRTAGFSKLKSKKPRVGSERDRFSWIWAKGEATTLAEFGDPTSTTTYNLCVYNDGELSAASTFAPDPDAWKATNSGYKRDEKIVGVDGGNLGRNSVRLRAGEDGRATIVVQESRITAPDPAFPFEAPVTVQFVNEDNGTCWESVFESDDFKKNQTDDDSADFSQWGYSRAVSKRPLSAENRSIGENEPARLPEIG